MNLYREIYIPLLSTLMLFWLFFVWFWPPAYLTLTVDDSFYYLKTAYNIAAGYGPTFDQVNMTNGFHPLWMALLALIAPAFGDNIQIFTQAALSIQILLLFVSILLLSKTAPAYGARYGLVMFFLLINFYFAKSIINAQESALQFFLLSTVLALWWKYSTVQYRLSYSIILGFVAALCTLARLDAIVFSLIALATPLIWPSEEQKIWADKERIAFTVTSLIVFGAVLLPYFIWNLTLFGHLMPVSGAIKLEAAHFSLYKATASVITVSTVMTFYLIVLKYAHRKNIQTLYSFLRYLFPLMVYVLFETMYTMAVRGRWVPEIWYLAPYLMLTAWLLAGFTVYIEKYFGRRVLQIVTGFVLIFYLSFTASIWIARLDPISYSAYTLRADAGRWLSQNTDKNARIGSWNAGILGAHSNRRLINLDGLINSWDYKTRYLDTNKVSQYIHTDSGIEYIAEYMDMRQIVYSAKSGTAMIYGVDFSSWYVIRARYGNFLSITNPKNFKPLIHLILSRNPSQAGNLTYTQFVKIAARKFHRYGLGIGGGCE